MNTAHRNYIHKPLALTNNAIPNIYQHQQILESASAIMLSLPFT